MLPYDENNPEKPYIQTIIDELEKVTGSLYSWGDNYFGQLGLKETDSIKYQSSPALVTISDEDIGSQPYGDDLWESFACGLYHTVMVRYPGTLWSCGSADYGQTGLGTIRSNNTPKMIGENENWKIVSCGDYHTVALNEDGIAYSFGRNNFGQLGLGNLINSSVPKEINFKNRINKISCGSQYTCCIDEEDNLYVCGNNQYGQLGLGHNKTVKELTLVSSTVKWTEVSAGFFHTAAIDSEGSLYIWGYNPYDCLGVENFSKIPQKVNDVYVKFIKVTCGAFHTIAIDEYGNKWVVGYNGHGQLDLDKDSEEYITTLTKTYEYDISQVVTESSNKIYWIQINASGYHNFGIKYYSGEFYLSFWGDNRFKLLKDEEKLIFKHVDISTVGMPWIKCSNDSHGGVFGVAIAGNTQELFNSEGA